MKKTFSAKASHVGCTVVARPLLEQGFMYLSEERGSSVTRSRLIWWN